MYGTPIRHEQFARYRMEDWYVFLRIGATRATYRPGLRLPLRSCVSPFMVSCASYGKMHCLLATAPEWTPS